MILNLLTLMVLIVGIAALEIRALLKQGQRETLVWFVLVHTVVSVLVVMQVIGYQLPNPTQLIIKVTMGIGRLVQSFIA